MLIKVNRGIAKNIPNNPKILPKINTDITIANGCRFITPENNIGTSI